MEDNKRKLYDALSEEYDLGSFEQFSADVADPAKRRRLYDATMEEYDFGDFDSFSKQLGFGKAAVATETRKADPVAEKTAETAAEEPEDDFFIVHEEPETAPTTEAPAPVESPKARETRPAKTSRVGEAAPAKERTAAFNERLRRTNEERAEANPELYEAEEKAMAEEEETRRRTAEDVRRYGTGNGSYGFEEAVAAGREYESLLPDLPDFDARLEAFEESAALAESGALSRDELDDLVAESKSLGDVARRYDAVMNTAPGREYKETSERLTAIAEGPKTPEAAWDYAQEYAKLQRNPVYRASLGDAAPSEDEIAAGLLQGQIAYIDERMKTAPKDERKELKKAFSDAKEALYANPWYRRELEAEAAARRENNEVIGEARAERAAQVRSEWEAQFAAQGKAPTAYDEQHYWQYAKGDEELQRLDAAAHMNDDAVREYENPTKYDPSKGLRNVGRGFGNWASDTDTWSFGLESFAEDVAVVRPVLEKVQSIVGNLDEDAVFTDSMLDELDKRLTPGEAAVLDAYFGKVGAVAAKGADTAIGYQIGQGIGDMVQLGLEMVATGGVGGAVRAANEKLLKKTLVKVLGKRAYRKAAMSGAGRVALWVGTKVPSDLVETAVRVPFMPSTYRTLGEKSVELDSDYKVRPLSEYGPEAAWQQYVEQLTEVSNGFGIPLVGKVVKTPGMAKFTERMLGKDGARVLREFVKRGDMKLLDDAMIGSFGGEWEEELLGAVIHSITDDPAALRDFFSAEQQLVLLGTLAPIPLARGGAGAVALGVPAAKASVAWDRAEKAMRELGYDDARIERVKDVLDNAPAPEAARAVLENSIRMGESRRTAERAAFGTAQRKEDGAMAGTIDQIDPKAYGPLARYYWAAQQKRAVGLMGEAEADERVADKRAELERSLGGTFTRTDGEGNELVETATMRGADGNPVRVFITSSEPNASGETSYRAADGSVGFVRREDLLEPETEVVSADRYLAGLVMQDGAAEQAAGLAAEAQAANESLRGQVEALEKVTHGGKPGVLTNADDEGATFVPDDPADPNVPLTWAELAAENGIGVPEVETPAERTEEAVEAVAEHERAKFDVADEVNDALDGGFDEAVVRTEDGDANVVAVVAETVDPENGTACFVVRFPNGREDVTTRIPVAAVLSQLRGETSEPVDAKSVAVPSVAPAEPETPAAAEPTGSPEGEPEVEAVPEPETEKRAIPVDEKTGEPIYDAEGVDPQDAYDDIVDQFGAKNAPSFILEQAEAAEKALADAQSVVDEADAEKAKVEDMDRKKGEGPVAFNKRKAEAVEKIEKKAANAREALPELRRRADFWNELKPAAQMDAAEERRKAEYRKKVEELGGVDPADMEPRSLVEAVADYLSAFFRGGGRLKRSAAVQLVGEGHDADLRKNGYPFVLSSSPSAMGLDVVAREIMDAHPGIAADEQEVLNAIGDLLLGTSRSDLGTMILRNRQAELEERKRKEGETPALLRKEAEEKAPEEPAPAAEPEPEAEASEAPKEEPKAPERKEETPEDREEKRRRPLRERAKTWSDRTGVEFDVVESLDEVTDPDVRAAIESGDVVSGWYRDGKVHVYMPHLADEADLDKTVLHELVAHRGLREMLGEENFGRLMDAVWKHMSPRMKRYFQRYVSYLKERGATEEEIRRAAADEYVARLAEDASMEPTAWEWFVGKVKEILAKMGIRVKVTDSDLEVMLRDSLKRFEKAERDRLRKSSEPLSTETLSKASQRALREKGLTMDGGVVLDAEQARLKSGTAYETPNERDLKSDPEVGDLRFSRTTINDWAKSYMSRKDAERRVVDAVRSLAERMAADELVAGVTSSGVYKYGEKSSGSKAGPLRTNIEYVVTFDMDTSCPRSLQYLEYVKKIEARIGRPMTQRECVQLIEMMRAYGQMIPCVYCYCENKRQALKQYYTDFMESRHAVVAAKTDEEALAAMYGHRTGKAGESTDPKAALNDAAYEVFLRWRQEKGYNPTLRQLWEQYNHDRNVVLSVLDGMLSDGRVTTDMSDGKIAEAVCKDLRIEDDMASKAVRDMVSDWKWDSIEGRPHEGFERVEDEDDLVVDPRTLALWKEMTAYGKSASQAKNVLRYVPYTDELKVLTDEERDYINGMGGLRMHSSNDFRIDYVLDYFQFMADMAQYGMKGHTYTKSPEFVKIFGRSGYKINMSIAAYEQDGRILPNRDEGFDWDEARRLREQFPDAGVMLMATSDAQIQFALDTDWIDMFIPFHASGLPKAIWYDMRGWTDYTSVQNERFLNAGEMLKALKADGVKVPKGAKADKVREMYNEHFGIRVETFVDSQGRETRIRPHFLPGPTVVHGVTIPGHNNDLETYLRLCREWGVHPRFYGMKVHDNTPEGGGRLVDITEHPAYMKCVKETARTDTPQTAVRFNFDEPNDALEGMTPIEYAMRELEARAAAEAQMAGSPVQNIYESYKQDPYGIVDQFVDKVIKHGEALKKRTGRDLPLDYLTPDSRRWAMVERKALEDAYKDFDTIPYHPHEYDEDGNLVVDGKVQDGTTEAGTDLRYRRSDEIEAEYPNWMDDQTSVDVEGSQRGQNTQVAGTVGTYRKVGDWIERNLGKDAKILDASSGLGLGTLALRERGLDVDDVEPYPGKGRREQPTYGGEDAYQRAIEDGRQYDYIISNAVLNVIPDDWRSDVLANMARLLKPGGRMFINTRKAGEEKTIRHKIELDSPREVLVGTPERINSYQRFFTPAELKEYVERELGDGYTVEVATKDNSGTSGLAAVVVTKKSGPMFRRSDLREPIARARAVVAAKAVADRFGAGFAPDVDSQRDGDGLVSSVMHDSVREVGFRRAFGKGWDEATERAYGSAPESVKARVDAVAQTDGVSRSVAVERYASDLLDGGAFDDADRAFLGEVLGSVRSLAGDAVPETVVTPEDAEAMLYGTREGEMNGPVERARFVSTYRALRERAARSHEDEGPDGGPDGGLRFRREGYVPTTPEVDQEPYDEELSGLRSQELDVLRSRGRDSREYKELKRKEGDVIRRYLEAIDPGHLPLNMVSVEGEDLEEFFVQHGDSRQQAAEDARFVRRVRAYGFYDDAREDISFFIEHVPSMEYARSSYVHERQHHLNNSGNLAYELASSAKGDLDSLESTLAKLTNARVAHTYREKYGERPEFIADEILAHAMTMVFDSPTFANDLKNLQLADEIYDFIIRLADEQFSQAVRPAIQSRAYGSITNSGGNQSSEQNDGGEPGEVHGRGGRGPSGSFGLPEEGLDDIRFRRFSVTPEQDAEYMAAVEAGDMDKAGRMVRDAFKAAFPDTKVVDENGEPMVMYHASGTSGITEFQKDKIRPNETDAFYNGFWFSSDEDTLPAWVHKEALYRVFLDIETPVLDRDVDKVAREVEDGFYEGAYPDARSTSDAVRMALQNRGYDGVIHVYPPYIDFDQLEKEGRTVFTLANGLKYVLRNGDDYKYEAYRYLYDSATDSYYEGSFNGGFDSVEEIREDPYFFDEQVWVAFEPTQIKSAEPVTYDNEGKVIPLSERFNPESSDIRFRRSAPGFVSNAAAALGRIKMDKATPEQWLKMLEKEGGLKAGEDKWIGLSDWLKSLDRKTVTKQEIAEYIAENAIQIEEVEYDSDPDRTAASLEEEYPGFYGAFSVDWSDFSGESWIDAIIDERLAADLYNQHHDDKIDVESPLSEDDYQKVMEFGKEVYKKGGQIRDANSTRLHYTTENLDNKREIALVVPTVEPYHGNSPEIHFDDEATEGRAVAWARFGDALTSAGAESEWQEFKRRMLEKYNGKELIDIVDKMTPEEMEEARFLRDGAMDERMGKAGRRVLVIDEIQSQRHEDARERGGYDTPEYRSKLDAAIAELREANEAENDALERYLEYMRPMKERFDSGEITMEEFDEFQKNDPEAVRLDKALIDAKRRRIDARGRVAVIRDRIERESRPAPAPFERNWHELAMKRMLRLAAEEGYDYVAWTTGEQQAERYNIGRAVDYMQPDPWRKPYDASYGDKVRDVRIGVKDGGIILITVNENGDVVNGQYKGNKLSELIGKELSTKILESEDNEVIDSDGLRVGGEGMKGFYDDILVRFMNKYGKKWGVKVEDITLPNLEESARVMHAVRVTPEMRESVMRGQTMFRRRTGDPIEDDENFDSLPEDARNLAFAERSVVRFRRVKKELMAATARTAYDYRVARRGAALREVYVDRLNAAETLEEEINREMGTKTKDSERFNDLLRAAESKTAYEVERFADRYMEPVFEAVGNLERKLGAKKDNGAEVVRYVALKHGLERNEKFAKRDAKRDHRKEYDAKIAEIDRDEKEGKAKLDKDLKSGAISDVTYQGEMQTLLLKCKDRRDKAKAKLDAKNAAVDAGTDKTYLEYREKDYAALREWFAVYDPSIREEDFLDPADYQRARDASKTYPDGLDDNASVEAAARAIVDEVEAKAGAETKALWKAVNAATKATLKFQLDHGIVSRDQYYDVSSMFDYYVPLRGFAEGTSEDLYAYYLTPNASGFAPTLLAAKGRSTMFENPFGMIGFMHASAAAQGFKNDAKVALLNFVRRREGNTIATYSRVWYVKTGAKDADGNDVWEARTPDVPEGVTLEERNDIVERFEEDMKALREAGDAKNTAREVRMDGGVVATERESHLSEHKVKVMEGGREHVVIVNGNPRAAQAVNGLMGGEDQRAILEKVSRITHYLAGNYTTWSIPFWVSNFQRDWGQGLGNAFIRHGAGYAGSYVLNRIRAFKTIFPLVFSGGDSAKAEAKDPEMARYFREFVENGGPMGRTRIDDNEKFERDLEKYLRYGFYDKAYVHRGAKAFKDFVSKVGETVETITRFAAYATSRMKGRGIAESVSDAKEISTNFARRGTGRMLTKDELDRLRKTKRFGKNRGDVVELNSFDKFMMETATWFAPLFRAMTSFFNAAVQGLQNKVENYRINWGRAAIVDGMYFVVGLVRALVRGSLGAAAIAAMFGGGGDDDKFKKKGKAAYNHVSDYLRRNNYLVDVPGTNLYLKWALPQEYRVAYALGDILGGAILEDRPLDDAVGDALAAVAQLGPVGVVSDEVGIAHAILPTAYAPIYEGEHNTNFTGARLYNEGFAGNMRDYPGWVKALPTTGKGYVEATRWLTEATGGDDVQMGWLEKGLAALPSMNKDESGWEMLMNPAVVEHFVESYTPGLVKFALDLAGSVKDAANGEWTVRRTPVLNRLVLNMDDYSRDAYYSNLYYHFKEISKEADRIYKDYKNFEPGENEKADAFFGSKDYAYSLVFSTYKGEEKAAKDEQKDAVAARDREAEKAADSYVADVQRKIVEECLDIYFDRVDWKSALEPNSGDENE